MTNLSEDDEFYRENDWEDPYREIIERNDIAALKRYMERFPKEFLSPTEMLDSNPYPIAVAAGNIDALRVLLDFSDSLHVQLDGPWESSLLDIACMDAQVDTARFLLDGDPPLGTKYAHDPHGGRALLSAAESLIFDGPDDPELDPDSQAIWFRDRIARSETLVYMLLDRGALRNT